MSKRRQGIALAALLLFLGLCLICLSCGGGALWLVSRGKLDLSVLDGDQTLRLFGDMPTTLDPALAQDVTSAAYIVEIFSGLVTLDTSLEVVPDIAERWEISDDGTAYTFHLREGVRFHDGKPVTAHDFAFSLERACSPELGSPVAALYLGDIVGAMDALQGRAKGIAGVRVLDNRTLQLAIDHPKAYFLSKLTYSTAFVVDRENVAQEGWQTHPNGTGAFKLRSLEPDRIELERYEGFYRDPARLARVRYQIGGGVPITLYENGELDIAEVSIADIERVQDPANPLHQELMVVPSLSTQYIAFNPNMLPFNDARVRRAFAHAVDKRKLVEVVLKGTATVANGVLPPGFPGYHADLQGLAYDPELARRLLAESKYGGADHLPPVVLHISGDAGSLPHSIETLLAMWEENLGVKVTAEAVDWPTFLQETEERRYPMYFLGWVADYPDPHNFLDLLFHGESAANHMGYRHPEVDRLLSLARVEMDEDRRFALYRQAEEIVIQDVAWIPLWHDREYLLVKPYVKNVAGAATVVPWLRDVYIDRNF